MENRENRLTAFFEAYAARFNSSLSGEVDVEGTVYAFAGCFVEASPVGIACSKNDELFREAIPKGYEFYRSIGTKSMEILSMDINLLDDFHAMVKIHWRASYLKKDNTRVAIEFDVIYLLQLISDIRIFAYITGDEQKALKENGLV